MERIYLVVQSGAHSDTVVVACLTEAVANEIASRIEDARVDAVILIDGGAD